ncbi:hypothetical protein hmeg3_07505 [Herbaspirillum sp. meg3]|nr:hypothetical protein hmeg3_07505 [Herbaspirillum sp. meg3]
MRTNQFIYLLPALFCIVLNTLGMFCLWSATRPLYQGHSDTIAPVFLSASYELAGMFILATSSCILFIIVCVSGKSKFSLLAKYISSFLARMLFKSV